MVHEVSHAARHIRATVVVGRALRIGNREDRDACERMERRLLSARVVTVPEQSAAMPGASPEGRYANAIQVGHNAFEFVLDFSQQYASAPEAAAHTRIITSPHYARGFLETLQAAIDAYEKEFGVIEVRSSGAEGGDAQSH